MTKTPTNYRETLQGILPMIEIERQIMDGVIKANKYLLRNFEKFDICEQTIKNIHKIIAGQLYQDAGTYRTHNVALGSFEPPASYLVAQYMREWEQDYMAEQHDYWVRYFY